MNISITGRHLEVTPSIKEYIQKKVTKIEYYFDHIMNVHVILEVNKLVQIAEVAIISDERSFFCEVQSSDMYESIDKLFDKIERQIRRHREEKINSRKGKSTATHFLEVLQKQEEEGLLISKVKEVAPKPMTEHEAILQLAMNNHKFEIFKEEKKGVKESVALKKDEKQYSLIQQNEEVWFIKDVILENNELKDINKKEYVIKTLTINNAVDRLFETQDDDYIIYRDEEDNTLNVLYLRKNQTLGLLTSGGIE